MARRADEAGDATGFSDVAWTRLHEVCLRGVCGAPHDEESAALVSAGFVRATPGGLAALPAGRTAIQAWARLPEASAASAEVRETYAAFLPLNREVKDAVSEWQRQGAAKKKRLDPQDREMFARLLAVDRRIAPVLSHLGQVVPRFGGYPQRLHEALGRVEDGNYEYLAGVMVDSYHTVWWHLDQDLRWALGLDRSEPGSEIDGIPRPLELS
jgi:hypothetical protein